MLRKFTFLILFVFTLTHTQFIYAQKIYNTEVGVLDSLHSDVLNESRKGHKDNLPMASAGESRLWEG